MVWLKVILQSQQHSPVLQVLTMAKKKAMKATKVKEDMAKKKAMRAKKKAKKKAGQVMKATKVMKAGTVIKASKVMKAGKVMKATKVMKTSFDQNLLLYSYVKNERAYRSSHSRISTDMLIKQDIIHRAKWIDMLIKQKYEMDKQWDMMTQSTKKKYMDLPQTEKDDPGVASFGFWTPELDA